MGTTQNNNNLNESYFLASEEELGNKNDFVTDSLNQKKVNDLNDKIEVLNSKFNNMDTEVKNSLNKDRISIITILGIFVAIFTFVSVEFQIFKYIDDFNKLLGFTFILGGILLLFILVLDYIVRCWLDMKNETKILCPRFFIVLFIIIFLIGSGLYCVNISREKGVNYDNEKELQHIQSQSSVNVNISK